MERKLKFMYIFIIYACVLPDLFEVVDRRAKLVVGEKPDELTVPTPGMYLRILIPLYVVNY